MLGKQLTQVTSQHEFVSQFRIRRSGRKTAACRPQAASAAADMAASVKQLLTKRSYAPPRYVGPIQVAEIPGKRYGLTATQNLPVGSLLLVVPALAVAFGPGGSPPSNAELVNQLDGQQLDPWQLQWLRSLYRQLPAAAAAAAAGDAADAAGKPQQSGDSTAAAAAAHHHQQQHASTQQLQMLQELLLQGEASSAAEAAVATDSSATAAAGWNKQIHSIANPFTTEQLQQIIAENAYSEISEDIGASILRELDPEAITGLWPEYALLNHSCAPNTVAVVVGQYLILRAVAPILAGEELTGSYLGKLGFSPVAIRRAYLSGVYGFHCQCPRCMCEQSTFPTTYYPADNSLLGMVEPSNQAGGSSGAANAEPQHGGGGLIDRLLGLIGLGQQQQQPVPSQQHMLLKQLHDETEQLAAAVQEAAVADRKRQDKQLSLLATLEDRVQSAIDAIEGVHEQLDQQIDRDDQMPSAAQAAKWILAAIYPMLDLRVQLLELLLSSGDLPVDDKYLLYDNQVTSSDGVLVGRAGRHVAAAGAAAAGRLSLSKSRRKSKLAAGGLQDLVGSLLSGQGLDSDAAGPVTKRQLLGLYVEALEQCVSVADAMARGSDIHIVVALKHMDAVRQLHGVESEETRLAEGLCSRAHAARYGVMKGPEEQQLLARLISARRRQLLGISLAKKMSVLAWESTSVRD